jgi:hypothetical protein
MVSHHGQVTVVGIQVDPASAGDAGILQVDAP